MADYSKYLAGLVLFLKAQLEQQLGRSITQKELAEIMGLHETAMAVLLAGKRKRLELKSLLPVLAMLPKNSRYEAFERILEDRGSEVRWTKIRSLGEFWPFPGQGFVKHLFPDIRIAMNGEWIFLERGADQIRVPRSEMDALMNCLLRGECD